MNPRRRSRDPDEDHDGDRSRDRDDKDSGRQSGSFLGMISRELVKSVQPAIVSLLTAGVTAKAAKPSEQEMENAAANQQVKEQTGQMG